MIVGVTGSRYMRPDRLVEKLCDFLTKNRVTELHHGDCFGWDLQCQLTAFLLGIKTTAHPPTDEGMWAKSKSDIVMPKKDYLERNKNVVKAVDFLIAAPDGPEKQRSGTWSTVRYAKLIGVRGVVWL